MVRSPSHTTFSKSFATAAAADPASQEKIEQLEKKIADQKKFYEDALEKRFNQMEEFEELAEKHEQDAAQARRDLEEANAKVDRLEGEVFTLSQKTTSLGKERNEDPGAEKKVAELQRLVDEKERQLAQKMEDNFNLKEMLDKQRTEFNKLKQMKENLQDRLDNKELQCQQLSEDMKSLEKRMRLYNQSTMNSEDAQKRANQEKQQQLEKALKQIEALERQLSTQSTQIGHI